MLRGNQLQFLTADDWVLIRARAVSHTFKLGEEIIREGALVNNLYIIRQGMAAVVLAGTSSRTVVATLGPDDVCGDMAFLERSAATAAVVAKDSEVEVDEINAQQLREVLESFPRLASRFYHSLALVLVRRLRVTTRELVREMSFNDHTQAGKLKMQV